MNTKRYWDSSALVDALHDRVTPRVGGGLRFAPLASSPMNNFG